MMDYIWIGAGGELTAFLNGGKASDGHWIWYPQPAKIATGVGGTRDQIRIADINGKSNLSLGKLSLSSIRPP